MRATFSFLVLLILILLCGALLASPVYIILDIYFNPEFNKVITLVTNICGLLLILFYLQFYKILNRETIGYSQQRSFIMPDLLKSFAAGTIIIAVLELLLFVFGIRGPEDDPDFRLSAIIKLLITALLSGLMVGILEETIYRGALQGGLQKLAGPVSAIITSSVIYSAVHFIKFPNLPDNSEIHWYTGLEVLQESFHRFEDPAIFDHFLALFAFGVLLALIRIKNGNIYQCIGLHAGAVFAIKIFKDFTDHVPDTQFDFLVNTYNHQLGYLALVWLILITVFYYRLKFHPELTGNK